MRQLIQKFAAYLMSMNTLWTKLSEKHKITVSSILVSILYVLLHTAASIGPFDERNLFGIHIITWFNGGFYGFLFAWTEIWKKDYKKAVWHFLIGSALFLLLSGITALLPNPVNSLFAYVFLIIPVISFMILAKIYLLQNKMIKDKKLISMVIVGGIIIKLLIYYLPYSTLGNDFYIIGDLIKAPLFYFFVYRIMEGRPWKELLEFISFSKQQILFAYLISWSTLLLSLYSLVENFRFLSWSSYGIEDDYYFIFYQIAQVCYNALTLFVLGHICIKLLTRFHRKIRKPFGWSYLLCFFPLVNFFALYVLYNYKSFVGNNVALWDSFMESERRKIAIGLAFLSLLGSGLSLIWSLPMRGEMSVEGFLQVLMGATISSLAIYSIFKGWINLWVVVLTYAMLYSILLSISGYATIGFLAGSLIVRILVLYIYYQAINPKANQELLHDIRNAHDLQVLA